jgi:hypothetical protein
MSEVKQLLMRQQCLLRTRDETSWAITEPQLLVVSRIEWASRDCTDLFSTGHCRRRKIRCLLASEDLQGRCSNCIRLKKDCNFFPVDQQPSLGERRSRTGSRAGAGGSSGSSSPSPGLSQSQSFDHIDDFNNYSPAGAGAPHEFAVPGLRNRTASVSSMNKISRMQAHSRPEAPHIHTGGSMSRGYDVAHSADGSSTWTSPFMDQSPASSKPGFEDPSSNFWRLAESPMTPAPYSTFAGPPSVAAHHHSETRTAFPIEGSREDVGWPLPSRSMSFGNVEGLSQSYSNHYPFRPDYKSSSTSGVYPHPIITSHASSVATMSAPSSAISEPKSMHTGYGAPPTWNAGYMGNNIGDMPRKSSQSFPTWYGEPGHLAQVDEEAPPHHFEEPMIYYPPAATQTQG